MRHPPAGFVLLGLLMLAPPVRAGIYYSGETFAELPSQWRGFLLDQRMLRSIAARPARASPASPARRRYEAEVARLTKLARERPLSADESAELGALYVRLGEPGRAVEVLRAGQRAYPDHFRLAANLGTAWQLQGDLGQAAACLAQAARLAPGRLKKAEELHLKLVRVRAARPGDTGDLDDLFGVRYVGPGGEYEPGRLAEAQRKRLPPEAVALVQQLALWLPADGRLLWQLGELAAASGDVATGAAILDGCVTEFGLRAADLRAHRRALRAAAEEAARAGTPSGKARHEGHASLFKPRSPRPLVRRSAAAHLPPVDPSGVNALPWSVVTETTLDRQYRPTFAEYLKELDGKQVSLDGFLQLLGDDPDAGAFLLVEYPVGCWYCEQPDVTAIVLVELPEGRTSPFTRGQVRVTGKLALNATDPENFLYTIREAKVVPAE